MRTLYLDCFAGISGDMFLGALIDLGVPVEKLTSQLEALGSLGFHITAEKVVKKGISGTKATVSIPEHEHHRHLPDIIRIIDNSSLSSHVKEKSKAVFHHLAVAEAKVHNTTVEKIHFHEVGALDAIVDIVGVVTALEFLEIDKIVSAPLPLGTGFVKCAHGTIPLPAPATLELLHGLPVSQCSIIGETVTPTGAALVKTLCTDFGPMPSMTISGSGWGAGYADREIPNLLRVVLGSSSPQQEQKLLLTDSLKIVEANIDDMNPEFYESIFPLLLKTGALDVYLTSVMMKKGRPAQVLTCLVPEEKLDPVVKALLAETTTLGVRISECSRFKLDREFLQVETVFGVVTVKVGRYPGTNGVVNMAPEWEDCKKIAAEKKIPVKLVYDHAKAAALKLL